MLALGLCKCVNSGVMLIMIASVVRIQNYACVWHDICGALEGQCCWRVFLKTFTSLCEIANDA